MAAGGVGADLCDLGDEGGWAAGMKTRAQSNLSSRAIIFDRALVVMRWQNSGKTGSKIVSNCILGEQKTSISGGNIVSYIMWVSVCATIAHARMGERRTEMRNLLLFGLKSRPHQTAGSCCVSDVWCDV